LAGLLALGAAGRPAPIFAADPLPVPVVHPMARDMLGRLLQAARDEPDPGRRRTALDNAVQGIPRAFYGLILDGIPSPTPGSVEHDVAQAVLLRWSWETPDFAANWAASAPAGRFRREALAEAAGCWAAKSPDDAAQWARSLPPDDRQWVIEQAPRFMDRASPSSVEAWQRASRPPP
jgi:hypothetical protein